MNEQNPNDIHKVNSDGNSNNHRIDHWNRDDYLLISQVIMSIRVTL